MSENEKVIIATEIKKAREHLEKKDGLADKVADNLFAAGNLALAGIVFVQLIPSSSVNFPSLLLGFFLSVTFYLVAIVIFKRRKR